MVEFADEALGQAQVDEQLASRTHERFEVLSDHKINHAGAHQGFGHLVNLMADK